MRDPITRNCNLVVVFAAVLAMGGCATDAGSDGEGDSFLVDGKADGSIDERSEEAAGVLQVVNQRSLDELDDLIGLDRRTATGIVAARNGADSKADTADDVQFTTLEQLDAVPYVGPVAFTRLLAYVKEHGICANSECLTVSVSFLETDYLYGEVPVFSMKATVRGGDRFSPLAMGETLTSLIDKVPCSGLPTNRDAYKFNPRTTVDDYLAVLEGTAGWSLTLTEVQRKWLRHELFALLSVPDRLLVYHGEHSGVDAECYGAYTVRYHLFMHPVTDYLFALLLYPNRESDVD